jgi:DNA-binding helix-turn-helix protein
MESFRLNTKIREIISFYQMSDRQFASRIGVNQSVIGSMFQKGTEPSAKVIRNTLLAFPEISTEWSLRDSGDMLKSNKEVERMNSLLDTMATLQEAINVKDKIISGLNEKIRQLENQIKTK